MRGIFGAVTAFLVLAASASASRAANDSVECDKVKR